MQQKFKIPTPAAVAAFADGADAKRQALAAEPDATPWADADNVRQGWPFSLRLTARQKAQLDYIAEHGGKRSAHAYVVGVLAPILEAESARLFALQDE